MDLGATSPVPTSAADVVGAGAPASASPPATSAGGTVFATMLKSLSLGAGVAAETLVPAVETGGADEPGAVPTLPTPDDVQGKEESDANVVLAEAVAALATVAAPVVTPPTAPLSTNAAGDSPAVRSDGGGTTADGTLVAGGTPGPAASLANTKAPAAAVSASSPLAPVTVPGEAANPAATTSVPIPDGEKVPAGASTGADEEQALGGRGSRSVVEAGSGATGHGETPVRGTRRGKQGPSAPSGRSSSSSIPSTAKSPTVDGSQVTHAAARALAQEAGRSAGAANPAAGAGERAKGHTPAASPIGETTSPGTADGPTAVASGVQGELDGRTAGQGRFDQSATGTGGDASAASGPNATPPRSAEHVAQAAASGPRIPVADAHPVDPPALRDVERLIQLDAQRPLIVRDGGEMRMTLESQGLGHVELRVAVDANAVHATLTASHEQTRDMLSQHRPQLEAALERSHLRLEGFNVNLGQHQQPRDPNDAAGRPWMPATPGALRTVDPAAPTSVGPVRPLRDGGALSLLA